MKYKAEMVRIEGDVSIIYDVDTFDDLSAAVAFVAGHLDSEREENGPTVQGYIYKLVEVHDLH